MMSVVVLNLINGTVQTHLSFEATAQLWRIPAISVKKYEGKSSCCVTRNAALLLRQPHTICHCEHATVNVHYSSGGIDCDHEAGTQILLIRFTDWWN